MNFLAYKKWAVFPEVNYSVKHSDTLVLTVQSVFMKFKFSILDGKSYPIHNEDIIIDYDIVKSIIQRNDQKYDINFSKKDDYTLVTISDANKYPYLLVEVRESDILSCISVGRAHLIQSIVSDSIFQEFVKPYEYKFVKARENYLIENQSFITDLEKFQKKHLHYLGK